MISILNKYIFLSAAMAPAEAEVPELDISDGVTFSSKVILFNDDWHTFDEVIEQIIKAVRCSKEKAEELTWEVHSKGKSCVYDGDLKECLKVSAILEEIALHTQIEY